MKQEPGECRRVPTKVYHGILLLYDIVWGFPKMGEPPKWVVYNGKSKKKVDDVGVTLF